MKKFLALFSLASLVLVGCTAPVVDDESFVGSEGSSPKNIVVSFYPLAFMTEQIVGDRANVVNLAGATDVHDYEPSPQDMVKINEADLVIFQGAELEPWAEDVIPGLREKGKAALAVSEHLDLMKHEDSHDDHDEDSHEEEHAEDKHHDEHEEDEHDDHGDAHDGHNHGEFDPHTWLDPVLAQEMVDEILESVLKIDTDNADFYKSQARNLKVKFQELDEKFTANLKACSGKEVIVSHDAFGYLEQRYDFEIHAIGGLSTNDKPSAKILAELKEEAAEGITHILVEQNKVRSFADTLASETGLSTLGVNPLGRGTLDENKDFFDVMDENLHSFSTALGCK